MTENTLWHSHFAYRTRRLVETHYKDVDEWDERETKRRRLQSRLAQEIAENGIKAHLGDYRIALFTVLYQLRD